MLFGHDVGLGKTRMAVISIMEFDPARADQEGNGGLPQSNCGTVAGRDFGCLSNGQCFMRHTGRPCEV